MVYNKKLMTNRPEEPAADLPRRLKRLRVPKLRSGRFTDCLSTVFSSQFFFFCFFKFFHFFYHFFLISFNHWLWHQDGRFWAYHFGGDGGESVALGRKLTDWLVTGSCSVGAAASGIRPKYLSVPAHISVAKPRIRPGGASCRRRGWAPTMPVSKQWLDL